MIGDPRPHRGLRCGSLLGLLLLASCCSKPKVEIFPARLQLAPNTDVSIAAHARGKDGVLKSGADISWTLIDAPNGISLDGSGVQVTLLVLSTAPTGSSFSVKATSHGSSDVLKVEIHSAGGGSSDYATAPVPPSAVPGNATQVSGMPPPVPAVPLPPAVALITASREGTCHPDSAFAFVGRADLGDWRGGCTTDEGRSTVFSPDRAPRPWHLYAWQSPGPDDPDFFDATSIPALSPEDAALEWNRAYPYTTVPLRIWYLLGITDDAAFQGRVLSDVSIASARFAEALAGVVFTYNAADSRRIDATADDCGELNALFEAPSGGQLQDLNAINVYYVSGDGEKGVLCDQPDTRNVILLSPGRSTTTLAHELGHALALAEPWWGHTDRVDGMSSDNLMWSGLEGAGPVPRYRLSLGQVFRINYDPRSWLNKESNQHRSTAAQSVDCGCDPYKARPCPRLAADTRQVGNPSATLPAEACQ